MRTVAQIMEKWTRVTQTRQQDYSEGVANPSKDWQTQTAGANAAYKAGVQASIAKDSFLSGVNRAGTAKWKLGATTKGPGRWAEGIGLSGDRYAKGYAPYADVITGLKLTPRGARGDAVNLQRVNQVANALHAKRVQLQGGK
jgi:hypothetical protein